MINADYISATVTPLTVDSLAEQLAAVGIEPGQTVLVHTKMSALGWVVGGPQAVIEALLRVLGPTGTLMMPTHTTDNTEPSRWQNPPVPEAWWPIIRANMPAFDLAGSPTRKMGQVAELFRTWPGVLRSNHPVASFAAVGPHARFLTDHHVGFRELFGEETPIARLYDLDGYVLMLGPDHENNTSIHLAEHRASRPKDWIEEGCAMMINGERRWFTYTMHKIDDGDFAQVGDAYEEAHGIPRRRVGNAEVRFMKQRGLVDYAVQWMERERK